MSRSHHKGGEPSQRMLRVGELVRHAVSELLTQRFFNNDVLDTSVITVSKVQMSPDLKCATIYVLPLGGKDSDKVAAALESFRKPVRSEVASRINLKFAPDIRFRVDETFENASKIDALLNSPKVRRDLSDANGDGQDNDNHGSGRD